MPSNDILQDVNQVLAETIDLNTAIKRFSKYEIKSLINSLKPRKSSGYDLISATLLKNLIKKGFTFLTYLYNAIFRLCFTPPQWKVAVIKVILKSKRDALMMSSPSNGGAFS